MYILKFGVSFILSCHATLSSAMHQYSCNVSTQRVVPRADARMHQSYSEVKTWLLKNSRTLFDLQIHLHTTIVPVKIRCSYADIGFTVQCFAVGYFWVFVSLIALETPFQGVVWLMLYH